MKEYVTDAIVLHTRPRGARDIIIDLFTKDFGRIEARAVHAQQIYAKFVPHCNVMNMIRARLVHKGGYTLTDALTQNTFPRTRKNNIAAARACALLLLCRTILPRAYRDIRVWSLCEHALREGAISFPQFLAVVGYDPRHACCASCGCAPVDAFMFRDHAFFCAPCTVQLPENELLLLS